MTEERVSESGLLWSSARVGEFSIWGRRSQEKRVERKEGEEEEKRVKKEEVMTWPAKEDELKHHQRRQTMCQTLEPVRFFLF